MKLITIENWAEFDRLVQRKHYRKWVFRGQTNYEWNLISSLERSFIDANKIRENRLTGNDTSIDKKKHEDIMIDKFMCNAHLYMNPIPDKSDTLSWLSLMQHHGAPTRLLDFTFSPYIALYFALEFGNSDASIYCVNHQALVTEDEQYFGEDRLTVHQGIMNGFEKGHDECLYAFEPNFGNHRLATQQGLFVAPNTLYRTHEDILFNYSSRKDDSNVIKIKIPASLRYSGVRRLAQMNITSMIIYPGLDGFCKSLKWTPIFGAEWQQRIGS